MIARHWRGWTKRENADVYQNLLEKRVLPELHKIEGYRGGYILRNDSERESEFVVINFFETLEAVKKFAGPKYTVAVFEPEAKALLVRFEPVAVHYEVRVNSATAGA